MSLGAIDVDFALWKVIVLAIVQGLTEFLPISSDGHLAIVSPLLNGGDTPEGMLGLTIILHLGTLASILVYYHRRILRLLGEDRRVAVAIVIGSIPVGILGILAKKWDKVVGLFHLNPEPQLGGVPMSQWAEVVLTNPFLAGVMLVVTGLALLFIQRCPPGETEYSQITLGRAWWIGCFQALAILPGLSRSGMTISSGVGNGLTRPSAAAFSFLLAIPALAAAGLLETKELIESRSLTTPVSHLLIGVTVSFVVGLIALSWLNRLLERGKLHYFAWYCFALAIVVIAWQGTRAAGWEVARLE